MAISAGACRGQQVKDTEDTCAQLKVKFFLAKSSTASSEVEFKVPDGHEFVLNIIKLGVQTLYSEMPSRMSFDNPFIITIQLSYQTLPVRLGPVVAV